MTKQLTNKYKQILTNIKFTHRFLFLVTSDSLDDIGSNVDVMTFYYFT